MAVIEEVCKQCGNTNGEHKPTCSRRSPKEWLEPGNIKAQLDSLQSAYARGLAEGRAQGLEEAAAELDNNGYGIMPKVLRDRAEQIRAENGGRE